MPKLLVLPCLFLAREAPPGIPEGFPKLSMTTHLLCIVGNTIWKLNLMEHTHSSALGMWREDQSISLGHMRVCLQIIQTRVEIDNTIMLGPLPPSAHCGLPQDCCSHRQDGLPSLVCSEWAVGSCSKGSRALEPLDSSLAPRQVWSQQSQLRRWQRLTKSTVLGGVG